MTAPALTHPLTPREAECLRLLARGESSKQIAHTLGLSSRSVDAYLGRARKKLGARNSTHAAVIASKAGLLIDP
ncbi:response regulator transcription factor [Nitrospirillum sp. BR 11163]|uniref:response regulator transcription factor n=1 Tax=Nitrospirillum sp. BR 11163 TaxID=3104323 RepID=UPI003A4C6BF1